MVRAWYYEGSPDDHGLPNIPDPPTFLEIEQLKSKLGINYFKLDACDWRKEGKLVEIMANRGYSAQDCIELSKDKTESFEEKHLHIDEELRFVIDGTGYFDVRDRDERWIRIETTKGDLIVIPAGIYHRFALDKNDYIKVIRCFSEEPLWKAYNRSDPATEKMDARQKYIASTD